MSTAEVLDYTLPFESLANPANHSEWRFLAAERIAQDMDYERFGVKAVYLIGSVERREAGPCSDIDLLVHVHDDADTAPLILWLDGWNKALSVTNYLRTGYVSGELLDIHIVTDREVREGDSFAVAMRDPAESSRLQRRE